MKKLGLVILLAILVVPVGGCHWGHNHGHGYGHYRHGHRSH